MKSKTRFWLVATMTMLVCGVVVEWLSYCRIGDFFKEQFAMVERVTDNPTLMAALRKEKQHLLSELALIHLASLGVLFFALACILNRLWQHMVGSPLQVLHGYINGLGRGTWTARLPEQQTDEINDLGHSLSRLGTQITFTAHQYATASKLAVLALIGQKMARQIMIIHARITAIETMLAYEREQQLQVSDAALCNLETVAESLRSIHVEFQNEFEREFKRYSYKNFRAWNGRFSRLGPQPTESRYGTGPCGFHVFPSGRSGSYG